MAQDLPDQRKGTQVLHVREDSGNELDALFKVAMNPTQSAQNDQIPMRLRNFPKSFWNPPEPSRQIQHSKQGSNDSTGYPGQNVQPGSNLQIAHMRAHSSPASLQQTLSTVPQPPSQPQHARQHSCDALLDNEALPPGWEMAKTPDGQRYYLKLVEKYGADSAFSDGHLTQITTWQDPRKTASSNALNSQHTPPNSQSPNVSMQNLGALPPGWEQAVTPEGDIYFINHIDRSTSWYDPRIPERMQQLRINSGQCPQVQQVQGQVQRQLPQQQMPPAVSRPQQPPGIPPVSSQFVKLQMEKERLRKRQEELQKQEMMLRLQMQQQPNVHGGQGPGDNPPTSQNSEMTTVTDPFLSQPNSANHIKQESADSGVGGMGSGNGYGLRTPEDFLSNVSEMDTQDGGHRQQGQQGEFSNMEIGNIGGNEENSNMDSEDLVPSLQEDISNELLNDMESVLNSNKLDNLLTDNLTWL